MLKLEFSSGERKKQGQVFELEEKRLILEKLDTKSTRDVDRILISESSNPEIHFKEKFTPKSDTVTEAALQFDNETIEALNRLREIWSHAIPHAKFADVIKRALKETVMREDPIEKAKRSEARAAKKVQDIRYQPLTPAPESTTGESPAQESKSAIKRKIWLRDDGRCTFADPRTGEICGSKHFVEEDHIVPKAMGGDDSAINLRLRCRAHNQRHAINTYGPAKMSQHLNRVVRFS